MSIKEKLKRISSETIIVDLLIAYALSSSALLLRIRATDNVWFSALDFSKYVGVLPAAAVIGGLFLALTLLRRFIKKVRVFRYLLFFSVCVYFSLLCYFAFDPLFCAFLYILCAVACYYCFGRTTEPPLRLRLPLRPIAAVIICAAFVFIALETSLRYANMIADNYDMGIYAQVFDHLAKTGKTMIRTATSEAYRFDSAPSLLLYPLTLLWMLFHNMYPFLILQAAALASGAVPLLLILRLRGASRGVTATALIVYFFYPGVWNGAFYDFHEQCFLVPLIFWALYFAEKGRFIPFALFALLTASVGADGAVIALTMGVYLFFVKKDRAGGILGVIAGVGMLIWCFIVADHLFLPNNGFYGNGSFFAFLLKDPGYLLNSLLNEKKLPFAILTILSLGGLPFITKRRGDLVLLAPLLILNLLGSDYNASTSYHHMFGTSALLTYVFIGALEGLSRRKKQFAAAFCALACLLTFAGQILPRAHYLRDRIEAPEIYAAREQAISLIPADASVTASPNFIAFLTGCDDIYIYYPAEVNEQGDLLSECNDVYYTDYTILDLAGEEAELNEIRVSELIPEGFETVFYEKNAAAVLKKS